MEENIQLSVLMSIYNEKENELRQSIESVLNQSFDRFEFIIVSDNPNKQENLNLLYQYANSDSRIIIIENSENIGLARSLNKAAEKARGKYLLRMDGDDISIKNRFEKQIHVIIDGNYDLVCSRYICIDENGNRILDGMQSDSYISPEEINQTLPFKSVIHHPTVIFKKEMFVKVKGYRNFPCAQDYDLWIRMMENDAAFYMINEPLLLYRMHENSISSKKVVMQRMTIEYIRKLYIRWLIKGNDSYSEDDYKQYIKKYIAKEKVVKKQIEHGNEMLIFANKIKREGKIFRGTLVRFFAWLSNPFYRPYFLKLYFDKWRIVYLRKHRY